MNVAVIINIVIVGSAIASLTGLVLYARFWKTIKGEYIIAIITINITIFALMVIIAAIAATRTLIVVFSIFTLGGIAFTILCILLQSIYLFKLKFMIGQFKNKYRKEVSEDPRLTSWQILEMSYPLPNIKMYIPINLYTEIPQTKKDDEKIQDLEFRQGELEEHVEKVLSAAELVSTYRCCVILGAPGVGKTTLLKYLAVETAKAAINKEKLPILVDLNRFAIFFDGEEAIHTNLLSEEQSSSEPASGIDPVTIASLNASRYQVDKDRKGGDLLLKFIIVTVTKGYDLDLDLTSFDLNQPSVEIQRHLYAGNIILLLDGLDEAFTGPDSKKAEKCYKSVCNEIEKFAEEYKKIIIIVTSRNASYELYSPLLFERKEFIRLYMLGFLEENIYSFIERWFDYSKDDILEEKSAKDLIFKLKRNPRLCSLASNPLLLVLIVSAYVHYSDLPDRRAELYDKCVETLLDYWDSSRGIDRHASFSQKTKQQLLEEVSWHFYKEIKYRFDKGELLTVIEGFLSGQNGDHHTPSQISENASKILNEISAQHGLLIGESKDDQKQYRFLHKTFQDFFTAKYALRNDLMENLLPYRGDPWWEEVFILYTDLLYQQGHRDHTFLQDLLKNDDIFYTNLALAGRCVATFSTSSQEVPLDIPFRLAKAVEKTDHSHTRTRLAKALAQIEGNAEALAQIEGNANERLLLAMILNNQNDQARCRTLIRAAVGQRSLLLKIVEGLVGGALDMSSRAISGSDRPSDGELMPNTRIWIAEELHLTGEGWIAPRLVEVLKKLAKEVHQVSVPDKQAYRELFGSIADTLSDIGDTSISQNLLALLDNSESELDYELKSKVVNILGVSGLEDRIVINKLLKILEDKSAHVFVRQTVVETLAHLGDRGASLDIARLKQILVQESSEFIRGLVLTLLYALREPSAKQQLLQIISSKGETGLKICQQLKNLLGKSQHIGPLVPELLNLLIETRKELEILPEASQVADHLRERSIIITEILSEHGDQDIIDDLVALLSEVHTNQAVDASIVRVLGDYVGESSMVDKILKFLTEERFRTRLYLQLGCVEVLGKVHGTLSQDSIYQQLQSLRDHPFERLRISVPITLYQLGDTSLRDQLIQIFYSQRIDQLRMTKPEKGAMSERLEHVLRRANDEDLVPELRKRLAKDWSIRKKLVRDDGEGLLERGCGLDREDNPDSHKSENLDQSGNSVASLDLSHPPQKIQYLERKVRQQIVIIIGEHADDKETCEELISYLDDPDLTEEIYDALWKISRRITSRRTKLRIFKATDESSIQVEELELPKQREEE